MDNKRTLQTIFIYALFGLFFILLIRMFYPFFSVILWTSLLYIIIYPLYRRCHNKLNPEKKGYHLKRNLLAGSFSILTMLIIISLFGLLVFMLSKQLVTFLVDAEHFIESNPNFLACSIICSGVSLPSQYVEWVCKFCLLFIAFPLWKINGVDAVPSVVFYSFNKFKIKFTENSNMSRIGAPGASENVSVAIKRVK